MSSPLLPKSIDLALDFSVSITEQIRAAIEAHKPKYAWFRALNDEESEKLVERLVDLTSPKIAAYTAQITTIATETMLVASPKQLAPALSGMKLTFSVEELQECCERVLPSANLRAQLLDELDLPHIFGDTKEDERLAAYATKLKRIYNRTRDVARFDPDGKLFMVDLADHLDTPPGNCDELDFVAFGCHGTAAATLRNLEGKKQLLSIIWRGIAGQQKAVGDEIVRFMLEKQRQGRRPFGFVLGDNFYESGIPNVSQEVIDELFGRAFLDIYNSVPARGGRREPLGATYFGALGNHDYNFHGHAVLPSDGSQFASNLDRALAQVDYTYHNHFDRAWNLPYRYYCVVSPVANFFVIDTSTFLFDKRQQEWLRRAYEKLAVTKRWSFLMAHHGFVTFGKRGAGHHAEKDLGKLAKTTFTKKALKDMDRGRTGASEASVLGAAAVDLRDNVNRHIFTWFAREGMHFHFNVVAHDHFLASSLLTYDTAPGPMRRTYYVLSGGGGAWPGGAAVDTLVRLGPNLSNIDLLEKKYGFAYFKVTRETAEVNFRFVDGKNTADAWGQGEQVFSLHDANTWSPKRNDAGHKRFVQPILRGVFYKRGEGGLFHSSAYKRRYFEIMWEGGVFRYGEKPGKQGGSGNKIDLRQIDPSSCSWLSGTPAKCITLDGVELFELTFRTKSPKRTWVFAAPPEIYADLAVWIDSSLPRT